MAPKGQLVQVDFSSFRLGTYCMYIYDSVNKENPVKTFRCRSQTSFTMYSTGRELSLKIKYIRYIGDTTGPGFITNYSATPAGER